MPLDQVIIYGLGDALNPCNLSTLVIFTAYLGWLRYRKSSTAFAGWAFVVLSFIASLIYATGGLMNILYSIPFFTAMRVFYVFVGVVFVVVAAVHLLDWVKIYKGGAVKFVLPLIDDGQGRPFSRFLSRSAVIVLAFVLNAFATVWPSNKFIMVYSNYLHVPGEFKKTMIMLVVYCVMLTLPLMISLLWMSWTLPDGWVSRNISKAKIMLSAFVMGLGISLVYIFT